MFLVEIKYKDGSHQQLIVDAPTNTMAGFAAGACSSKSDGPEIEGVSAFPYVGSDDPIVHWVAVSDRRVTEKTESH